LLLLLIIPVVSTLIGGLLAVRLRRSVILLLALGAGLLLGAAFLDLLPEALTLAARTGESAAHVLGWTLLSFFLFAGIQTALDAFALRWKGSEHSLGRVGGGLLIFHSLRDGMAIGLSYAASHPAGYAVAVGIATHDIADGMNTILLTTRGQQPRATDYLFLLADSLAPLAGGLLTIWCTFSARSSVVLLALAAGFFLQMATSDFLPEVRRSERPTWTTLPVVFCGAGLIYVANVLLGQLQ